MILDYLLAQKEDKQDEDKQTWDVHDPEQAWRVLRILKAMDWKFLPDDGGLLDQDDMLFEDIVTVSGRLEKLEKMFEAGDVPGAIVRDYRPRNPEAGK